MKQSNARQAVRLPKSPLLSPSQDYKFLVSQGIRLLELYTSNKWTDYNSHDPGITILEALCYAITELGLQANLEIQDLVASSLPNASGSISPFFEADKILPIDAYTLNDFRKLLLDITIENYATLEGTITFQPLRGAWMDPAEAPEQVFYRDKINRVLSYTTGESFDLKGLYNVQLEFNNHPDFGDVNSSLIRRSFSIAGSVFYDPETINFTHEHNIDIAFPYWDEVEEAWGSMLSINSIVLDGTVEPYQEGEYDDYFAILLIDTSVGELRLGLSIKLTTRLLYPDEELPLILSAVGDILIDTSVNGVISEFNNKVVIARELSSIVDTTLRQNRNLAEDFLYFEAVRIQEIGVSAEMGLLPGADSEEVIIQVMRVLEEYFSPLINRYNYNDFKNNLFEGREASIEEIIEGPLLSNGLIDDATLGRLDPREVIYTSDIIRMIMELNKAPDWKPENRILHVSNVSISNFINNQEITLRERNCLRLNNIEKYRPRLSYTKSSLSGLIGGVPVQANINTVIERLDTLKTQDIVNQVEEVILPEVPVGQALPTGTYTSVQELFPAAYKLGNKQVAPNALPETLAQARQLKGYLLPFEQQLIDYLAQIQNINSLFSIGAHEESSYYQKPLYTVPEIGPLIQNFSASGLSWAEFIEDPQNSYLTAFRENDNAVLYTTNRAAIERFSNFLDRRYRFLSHMQSRFSEQMDDYKQFRLNWAQRNAPDTASQELYRLRAMQEIIYDQSLFLQDYVANSRGKASSFNYFEPTQFWDTEQVIGLEKRIARALGIRSYRRRDLFQSPTVAEPDFQVVEVNGEFFIEYLPNGVDVILRSIPYIDQPSAESAIAALADAGQLKANYRYGINHIAATGTLYIASVFDIDNNLLATSVEFETEQDRAAAINQCIYELSNKYSGEGLFVVEHLLLRPRYRGNTNITSDAFLPLELDTVGEDVIDPYSFRISVLLPSGLSDAIAPDIPQPELPARFRDSEFRALAEQVILRETPAHIKANVFWLSQSNMESFQALYRIWLERIATPPANTIEQNDLINAQRNLVSFLNSILIPSTI